MRITITLIFIIGICMGLMMFKLISCTNCEQCIQEPEDEIGAIEEELRITNEELEVCYQQLRDCEM